MPDRKMSYKMNWRLFVVAASLLTFAACATPAPPAKFYILHPVETSTEQIKGGVALGVGPVAMADYLNRPQIVTRVNDHELRLAEFERWAGSLQKNVSAVLAENLSALLSSERIQIYPWRGGTQIDYQLVVNVIRFDGAPGGDLSLKATWALYGKNGKKALISQTSSFSESVHGNSFGALAAAHSKALGRLSREIALVIKDQSGTR